MTKTSATERAIINRFFAAMQTGALAEREMMALFAEDAIYVEPFSGHVRTHRGKPAILAAMREGWAQPIPNLRIVVDEVRADSDMLVARWTCYSTAMPGGQGRGENIFKVRNGKIEHLETSILPSA